VKNNSNVNYTQNSVRTSQATQFASITRISRRILRGEIMVVYRENDAERVIALCKNTDFLLVLRGVKSNVIHTDNCCPSIGLFVP
jgi:tRNA1(Val) A37 N6-methylase TrmN6